MPGKRMQTAARLSCRHTVCNRSMLCAGMQDYDEALSLDASSVLALLRKGKAWWALNKPEVRTIQPLQHRHPADHVVQ